MPARAAPGTWRFTCTAGAVLGLYVALCPGAFAQVEERALKAAFVYNIIAFTEWETGLQPDTLRVCTAVDPGFTEALATLEGKQIGTRQLRVRPVLAPAAGCDVLVRAPTVPPGPEVAGRLVVCDGCVLPDAVTAATLVRDGTRVRFEVDTTSGGRVGLSFSSRLLRLARRVL
ncbi:YfiR family protein [Luteimonas sp. 3794]|uniref:YfiR family protein n=1 Tax=Luteimonas sp. 3794 TaxID=2817730 RepID=UPI00285E7F49|nr:YfiR family protein [Luteimonas sp. 3794]MDR6990390.1 hypothetical protein [Luteimonas sp. 3794]